MIERLKLLQTWGINVSYRIALSDKLREFSIAALQEFGTPLKGTFYEVDGIPCSIEFSPSFHTDDLSLQTSTEKYFLDIFSRENPDLVWSHYTDFFATTAALQWKADATWIDLTDNEFPRQAKLDSIPSVGSVYRNISHLMVASPFMERVSKREIPKAESILLPNIIEFLKEAPIQRNPESWIFVNPTEVKGVVFVLELSRSLPNENFIFVGNWTSERPMNLPKNVSFVPRQQNLREVFKGAKGLLVPSVWEEAFGRVPLEAMAMGVPVIASNRGALPETIGLGGLCLPLEKKAWIDALSQPSTFWLSFIEEGFKRVKDYRAHTDDAYAGLKQRIQKFL